MQKKLGSPLKVLGQTVALAVVTYIYGSPALSDLRPGFLNTPFEQFYLAVNSVLRDGKIDTGKPSEMIVSTSRSVQRQIGKVIGGD